MLGGDFLTLRRVHGHHFVHDVAFGGFLTLKLEEGLEVQGTSGQAVTRFHAVARLDYELSFAWNFNADRARAGTNHQDGVISELHDTVKRRHDGLGTPRFAGDDVAQLNAGAILDPRLAFAQIEGFGGTGGRRNLNDVHTVVFPDFQDAIGGSNPSLPLWRASFQQLFHTRQTAGDFTRTSHARTVLGIQRQLCAWFTQRLCGDHPNWLVGKDQFPGGHVSTVSAARNTIHRLSGEDTLNLNRFDVFVFSNLAGHGARDQLVRADVAWHGFGGVATSQARFKANPDLVGFRAEDFVARIFGHLVGGKDVLSHVDQAPGQITRLRSTQSRRYLPLAGTTGSNKALQSVKTALVTVLHGQLDFAVVHVHHHADFCRSQFNIRHRTAGARVHHHGDIGVHFGKFTL